MMLSENWFGVCQSQGYWTPSTNLPYIPQLKACGLYGDFCKDEQEARATLNEMGLPLFKGNIRRLVAFQKAALAGVPVYEVSDPKARTAWEDYKQIGKELGIWVKK